MFALNIWLQLFAKQMLGKTITLLLPVNENNKNAGQNILCAPNETKQTNRNGKNYIEHK